MSLNTFGSVLVFIAFGFYIFDILFRDLKPNRVAWAALTLNGAVLLFSYREQMATDGMTGAALLIAMYTIGPGIIFLLALWKGEEEIKKRDLLCGGGSLFFLILWQVTDIPGIAIWGSILVDFFALLPILLGVIEGEKESLTAWSISQLGDIVSLIALDQWTVMSAAYPVYVAIWNAILIAYIVRNTRRGYRAT
jgi:hypothetical protein